MHSKDPSGCPWHSWCSVTSCWINEWISAPRNPSLPNSDLNGKINTASLYSKLTTCHALGQVRSISFNVSVASFFSLQIKGNRDLGSGNCLNAHKCQDSEQGWIPVRRAAKLPPQHQLACPLCRRAPWTTPSKNRFFCTLVRTGNLPASSNPIDLDQLLPCYTWHTHRKITNTWDPLLSPPLPPLSPPGKGLVTVSCLFIVMLGWETRSLLEVRMKSWHS